MVLVMQSAPCARKLLNFGIENSLHAAMSQPDHDNDDMLVMNTSTPAGTENLNSSSAASICTVGSKLKQPCQLTYQVSHICKSADFTLKSSSCSASKHQDCGSELNTSEIAPFRLFNTAFPMHGLDCPKRRDFHVHI